MGHRDLVAYQRARREEDRVFEQIERDNAKLLPCPFCGANAHLSGCFPDGHYQVKCTNCRALMVADRQDKAIGMWNNRTVK